MTSGGTSGVAIDQVSFSYGDSRILENVSLDIAKGEFFAFLGPSGSGKTTLLRLIAGFGIPSNGRVLLDGRDVTQLPPWSRNVGLVFQNYALWPHMTVARNVAFGLERRRLPKAEIHRKVGDALQLVGLSDFADRRPAQLSGGQQQRVALARTIVIEPTVLLLDEPLSNLDANLRVEMRSELRELQQRVGITAVYVTHDQEDANAVADRVAVLDRGRIQQIGTPIELYDHPANRFVAGFLGTANVIDGEFQADGRFVADGFVLDNAGGPAGRAAISIRPQDIELGPPGSGLPAVVTAREFLGGVTRYRIRIGGTALTADVPHRRDAAPLPVGTEVGVQIDARQASILR